MTFGPMRSSLKTFALPVDALSGNLTPMETSGVQEIGVVLGMLVSCVLFLLIPALFIFTLVMALTRKTKGWIIGAVVTGVVGLLFVGGIIFSGIYAGFKAAKASREAQVFTSPDGLCSITGAPGWRVLDLEAPDATLQVGNLFAEEYLIIIPDAKAELGDDFLLEEFAEIASGQTLESVGEGEGGELVELEIGGLPGYRREVRGVIEGNDISYHLTYLEGKDYFYQIMAWTLTDKKATVFPKLEAAAASFSEITAP